MTTFNIDVTKLDKIRTKKLTYKGQTKDMDVYRVPIDSLFYNDMNGRIATYISQYKAENNDITELDNNQYNEKIAEFIKASSTEKRFNKTKEDIRDNTQKEVGVVLTDGRIIDGNRRFTCLRELFKETGDEKFSYFEAVVLPAPDISDSNAWKAINSLELELQIGTDEKVDYSPIDWLVKVYNDIVKGHFYTETEYCRLTKYSPSDVKKMIVKAALMEDFLEFFDKPEQFFIAKRLELDGPLTELVKVRRKFNDREWDEVKVVFYVYLWTAKKGDKSREVRRMIGLIGLPEFAKLIESANEEAENIFNAKENDNDEAADNQKEDEINPKTNNDNEEQKKSFHEQIASAIDNKSSIDARNKPINACENALRNLNDVDMDIVNKWKDSETKQAFINLLKDLKTKIEELEKHVSEE